MAQLAGLPVLQEDFLACMKLRMAHVLEEAKAVAAVMAAHPGLHRPQGMGNWSSLHSILSSSHVMFPFWQWRSCMVLQGQG